MLLTAEQIAALAIELLQRQFVLVGTVARVPSIDPPSGGEMIVRVPHERTAREQETQGAAITLDPVSEHGVALKVKHLYDAAAVSDWDLSLTIASFGSQILQPMTDAVARAAEDELAGVLNGLPADDAVSWAATPSVDDDLRTLLDVRKALTDAGCPVLGRTVACSTDITNRLLAIPLFAAADKRGAVNDTGATTALDAAVIGDVYGLTVVESAALEPGTAVGYHASAAVVGTAPPAAPNGTQFATVDAGGVTIGTVIDYDAGHLSTIVAVHTFCGARAIVEQDDTVKRAIRVTTD